MNNIQIYELIDEIQVKDSISRFKIVTYINSYGI